MSQHIVFESRTSLLVHQRWFGERAVQAMLEITDIISPYFQEHCPYIPARYQTYFVNRDGTDYKILSNLIVGCPTFYPILEQRLAFDLQTNGFRVTNAEIDPRIIASAYNVVRNFGAEFTDTRHTVQNVLALRSLSQKALGIYFGEHVNSLLRKLNTLTLPLFGDDEILSYRPYVIRQENKRGEIVYEGIALTNLVRGFPCVQSIRNKPHPANRTGGFRSISLPKEILEEVQQVDLRGCNLEPAAINKW